jgi:hypothetical protein
VIQGDSEMFGLDVEPRGLSKSGGWLGFVKRVFRR